MRAYRLPYGSSHIAYELTYTRRKSVGITVHADRRVTVRAPHGVSAAEIEKIVRKKGEWILKKQQAFEAYPAAPPPHQYVSGEIYFYLGQRYRLRLIEDKDEGVQANGGRLILRVRDTNDGQRKEKLVEGWYRQQATILFPQRLTAVYPRAARLGIPFPQLKIRKMKSRWGSCSSKGTVTLNLKLIEMPEAVIDYVLLHELAHLKEHNHSKAYYRVLDELLPDWKERREELKRFQITWP